MNDKDKSLEDYYMRYTDLDGDGKDISFSQEEADVDDLEAQARSDAADARVAKRHK
ncbi:YfhD-like protein [Terribacillus saccharophilus]|uniref:YfhD-like protein n=2 Tax=Terribacillus saccharophilus TaxID=361277 RepID=A0AAX2EEY8_9BACI|nr:YfhD-like protein [Terribacillus saccharophilus]